VVPQQRRPQMSSCAPPYDKRDVRVTRRNVPRKRTRARAHGPGDITTKARARALYILSTHRMCASCVPGQVYSHKYHVISLSRTCTYILNIYYTRVMSVLRTYKTVCTYACDDNVHRNNNINNNCYFRARGPISRRYNIYKLYVCTVVHTRNAYVC